MKRSTLTRSLNHVAALLALLGSLWGCQDDLPKATLIERMRIMGSQLSVVGDETRATPKPGENVRVSFATVFPDLDGSTDEAQLMLLSCTAPDRFTGGIPICQEFIDAATQGDFDVGAVLAMPRKARCSDIPGGRFTSQGVTVACVNGDPSIQLPIKARFEAESAMFIGILCETGRAFIDPQQPGLFGCDDNDGESIPLHATFPVQLEDEDENHNPSARDLALRLPLEISVDGVWQPIQSALGAPMVETDAADAGTSEDEDDDAGTEGDAPYALSEDICSRVNAMRGDPPHLPRGDIGHHTFALRFPASAREEVDGEPEPIEISVHATSGDVERRFTVFTADSDVRSGMLEAALEWQPDKDPPEGGKLVRFFVTVRDQRGGFDMATYALCSP